MDAVKNSPKERGRPFKKGESGNPRGRPKGSRNKRTLEALAQFAARGDESPLDVLLEAMHWFCDRARSLRHSSPLQNEAAEVARQESIGASYLEAATIARTAAPYLHARLSPTENIAANADRHIVVALKTCKTPFLENSDEDLEDLTTWIDQDHGETPD